jgi:DNA excision repair protein ERCC-6
MQVSRAEELTSQVVAFLEAHDGAAPTAELVDHFQSRVPAARMPLFRQLLKQVAALRRHPDGRKLWTLKPEYVADAMASAAGA